MCKHGGSCFHCLLSEVSQSLQLALQVVFVCKFCHSSRGSLICFFMYIRTSNVLLICAMGSSGQAFLFSLLSSTAAPRHVLLMSHSSALLFADCHAYAAAALVPAAALPVVPAVSMNYCSR